MASLAQARAQLDSIFTQLREVEATRRGDRDAKGGAARPGREPAQRRRAARARSAGGARTRRADRDRRRRGLPSLPTSASATPPHWRRELLEARGRAENAEQRVSSAQAAVAAALSVQRDRSGEVAAAQSRLHTIEELENSLEGHVPGTRAVVEAWQRGELRGIEGIVSNLITTDERFARAMDVAFGARLSNIVTTTSEDAERAIEFLNREEAGRATFLPLDTLADRDGTKARREARRPPGRDRFRAHAAADRAALRRHRQLPGRQRADRRSARDRHRAGPRTRLARHHRHAERRTDHRRRRDHRRPLRARTLDSLAAAHSASLRESLVGMRAKLEESEAALRGAYQQAETAIAARDAARERQAQAEAQLVGSRAQVAALTGDVATHARASSSGARRRGRAARTGSPNARDWSSSSSGANRRREQSESERTRSRERSRACAGRLPAREAAQNAASDRASHLRERSAGADGRARRGQGPARHARCRTASARAWRASRCSRRSRR